MGELDSGWVCLYVTMHGCSCCTEEARQRTPALTSGGGGAVVRTSSAEKRSHSVYKQLTSCSSSSSSDDELKELQSSGRDKAERRFHVRHKPPQKERRIVNFPSASPDDDEVFSYSKPGCMSKRLKCSAPQPIPGRYTDFDKMRKTPMLQVSKVRSEDSV